jgi:LmbE family N-acetylglucosaminyl deacetylase
LWIGNVYINHPDHKAAGEAALCAVMPDAPSRPQFPELLNEGFEPFEVPALWLAAEDADTFVDIGPWMETKIKALACHESQADNGMEVEKIVYSRAKAFGEQANIEYAEGFRTFSFVERDEE